MAQFDQRGQQVTGQQYNAGRDISFGAVQNTVDFAAELEHLQQAVAQAAEQGLLPEETSIDVEAHLKKALVQAKKTTPEKKTLLDHLSATKALIENLAAASSLVPAVVSAIEAVHKLFP
jgi:hypothetical protein